jgi:predicted transcriptional regulator of viral defense system
MDVMLLSYEFEQSHDIIDHEQLYRVAESQAGYFTARQAAEAGMGRSTLAHHAGGDGRFERVGRGVYRLRQFPSSQYEHIVAGWLSLGDAEGVVSHASALELHDLSDVIADVVHVTVPRSRRWRRQRAGMRLHLVSRPLRPDERQWVMGLPVTIVERTIADYTQDGGQPEQVEVAVVQAISRRLTTPERLHAAARERSGRVRKLIERAIAQAR